MNEAEIYILLLALLWSKMYQYHQIGQTVGILLTRCQNITMIMVNLVKTTENFPRYYYNNLGDLGEIF